MPLSTGNIVKIPACTSLGTGIASAHKSLCDVEMSMVICHHRRSKSNGYLAGWHYFLERPGTRLIHIQERSDESNMGGLPMRNSRCMVRPLRLLCRMRKETIDV